MQRQRQALTRFIASAWRAAFAQLYGVSPIPVVAFTLEASTIWVRVVGRVMVRVRRPGMVALKEPPDPY
jgi:hypothetical protein